MPIDQMSTSGPYFLPPKHSGAVYAGEPHCVCRKLPFSQLPEKKKRKKKVLSEDFVLRVCEQGEIFLSFLYKHIAQAKVDNLEVQVFVEHQVLSL